MSYILGNMHLYPLSLKKFLPVRLESNPCAPPRRNIIRQHQFIDIKDNYVPVHNYVNVSRTGGVGVKSVASNSIARQV